LNFVREVSLAALVKVFPGEQIRVPKAVRKQLRIAEVVKEREVRLRVLPRRATLQEVGKLVRARRLLDEDAFRQAIERGGGELAAGAPYLRLEITDNPPVYARPGEERGDRVARVRTGPTGGAAPVHRAVDPGAAMAALDPRPDPRG
jgi:hypothetical protein